ncbi:MAG TPA: VWA domain-containing protein [Blastocatellia bacterium]|nr:VWA domain-containing protein [Blastocatellia bacterium]
MSRPVLRMGNTLFSISIISTYLLICSLASAQQLNTGKTDDSVKLRVNMINLNVSVIDPDGKFVRGLSKENFEVFEDKTQQSINLFAFEDLPISIGFIFDVSGSMTGKAARARDALREFVNICHPDDEMFLIGFNTTAKLLVDNTKNDSEVINSVTMMPTAGNTALYDAVYMGVEKLKQSRYNRKVLLIISDGQDNNSRYTEKEIKDLVKESDVEIFSIGTTAIWQQISLDDYYGMEVLDNLGTMTGGTAYFPRDFNEMARVCHNIGAELRNQYSIGYVPTNAKFDGKWRKLKVRIKGVKDSGFYVLRTRNGYYARQ